MFCNRGDQDQSGNTAARRPSLQRQNALRRSISPRVNSASLAGTPARTGSVVSAGNRPVSPIEHDWYDGIL
ncbi:hypothetical protein RRF57_000900 [Xylaria bambusicola]|uniref:Uncharacterized protein n=1 Tax=Xylaria bambusicola TaxID=326684 RepID=A0AAN7UFD5_9PEZI